MNLDNVARKINQRMVRLAKQLGKDSHEYQKQVAAISAVFDISDSKQIYINADGVIQIKRGKTNLQNKVKELETISKLPTYHQIAEKTKKEMQAEKPKYKPSSAEIKRRIKQRGNITKFIHENIAELYVDGAINGAPINRLAQDAIKILTQNRNTWDELEKAMDLMQNAIDSGIEEFNYFEPEEF